MIKSQVIIDSLSAQDIINMDRADLEELDRRRIKEIIRGLRWKYNQH